MQRRVSSFIGYSIEAVDGHVGSVSDVLFQDDDWTLRWFVIKTGGWLSDRKVLIHPSALDRPDLVQRAFPVALTKAQIEASPSIETDEPVSLQMSHQMNAYYGYAQAGGAGYYGTDDMGLSSGMMWPTNDIQNLNEAPAGDSHLRSVVEITNYHIHALDGDVGHIEDFMVEDESWKIDYVLVNTKNWGFGKHVLVAPAAIKELNYSECYVRIDETCYKIRCSPSWTEPDWSERPHPQQSAEKES